MDSILEVNSAITIISEFPVKFRVQWSVKKVMLIVVWDMKGIIIIDSLEKVATINITFYC